jgi:hypothetical protein
LHNPDKAIVLFDLDRLVVGVVGAWQGLWRVPQAIPAIDAPLITAGLAEHFGELFELVVLAHQAQADDARTNVRSHHQID